MRGLRAALFVANIQEHMSVLLIEQSSGRKANIDQGLKAILVGFDLNAENPKNLVVSPGGPLGRFSKHNMVGLSRSDGYPL